jgi:membrane protease YdiL (CAAX protease family)
LVIQLFLGFTNSELTAFGYVISGYSTLMYLILSILLCIEMRNLEQFHIDKFTIITFIVGALVRRKTGIPIEFVFFILIGFGGLLVVTQLLKRPIIPRTSLRWTFLATGVSCVFVIAIALFELKFRDPWALPPLFRHNLAATVIGEIVKELSFGALIEEILFRGFVWGYLKTIGWTDLKSFWLQGLLFWMLHFDRIVTPFSFFVFLPLLTLMLSLFRLRTKQIYPSIVAHIVVNVIASMLNLATY